MEAQTYDPVLSYEELPKWRLTSPVRPPRPGRALVLVRDSGPSLTIRSGEEIPSSRFGAYSGMYTVDMTEHRLVLDIPLLSRDPTFSFRSRVDLVCRVADPAQVVSRGIRDMSATLFDYLRKTLREVARDYDIADFHQAERALNGTVAGFTGDDAVRLRNVHVELLVDEDEIATSGRAYRDVVRETRLSGMRRGRHLDMIRKEGLDGLIAEIMEKEGPRAALTWIEKNEAEKREVRREIMRLVLERGDSDREPFEQAELERTVLEEVLREGDGLFDGAARRGRLRGSLARASDPAPALEPAPESGRERRGALRGEVVREEAAGDATRPGGRVSGAYGEGRTEGYGSGRRAGRAADAGGRDRDAGVSRDAGRSGYAGRSGHAGPPEDEPLPDPREGRERYRDGGPYRDRDRPGPDPGADRDRERDADRPGVSSASGGPAAEGTPPRVSRVRGTTRRDTPRPGPDRER
ncbi:hypothetical protein [Streptomyces sp. CB02261]|uniref:hypothetical protein n=1 Tax=Streptomyces sp. CB02261 TaxID=1703940 RepID=UPI0009405A54|nr:hypothetical protein [Streptomyces sp. CB02261]OKJ60527.1 hypothetical protein AMK29_25190 [Streptomyces sp. CB02261]